MTDPASGRRLLIDADMDITVDGVEATVTGRGHTLTLQTDQPVRLWRALRRSGLPEALQRLDQRVGGAGVVAPALTVEGPHGPVAGIAAVPQGGGITARTTGTGQPWVRPRNLVSANVVRVAAAIAALIVLVVLRRRGR